MNSQKGSVDELISTNSSPEKKMPSIVGLRMQQLKALLWKCWVMRCRHPVTMLFDLILMVSLTALMAWLGSKIKLDQGGSQESNSSWVPPEKYEITDFDLLKLSGMVHYAPNTTATYRVMSKFKELAPNKNLELVPCIDEADSLNKYLVSNSSLTSAAVIFNSNLKNKFDLESNFEYTIKVDGKFIDSDKIFPVKFSQSPVMSVDHANGYVKSKFVLVQMLLNEAFLSLKAADNGLYHEKRTITLQPHPYPGYTITPSASIIVGIALVSIFGLTISFPILVKRIADEESNRSREMFRMIGVPDWIYWLSHLVNNFVYLSIFFVILNCCMFIKFNGSFAVLNHSNPILVYLIFLVFLFQSILFGFILTIPFNKPVIAVIAAIVIWIVVWAAPVFSFGYTVSKAADTNRAWCSMLPPAAIYFIFQIVGDLEIIQRGLTWSSLFNRSVNYGNSVGSLVLVMIFSSLLYVLVFLYLDAVWPFKEGVPKPFYFPLLKSYWCPKNDVSPSDDYSTGQAEKYFEQDDVSSIPAIKLKNVSKVYGTFSKKRAVDNLSMTITRGHITCLLGENGAGKTTTMSMITGMFPPTKGSIEINGYDLLLNTSRARQSLSFCPQHNPLYSELTVREHLFLYAALKGHPWNDLDIEISKTIQEVTLTNWDNFLAPNLSGGMKRKLCLGIALIGGTSVVILDEPTTGLDPEVRRSIWELLLNVRHHNRTILISTHFMEEADALGDRIAIMTSGQLTCYGSTMFLKNLFGAGYSLRIAKKSGFKELETDTLITSFIPGASICDQSSTEVVYSLQSDGQATDTKKLPSFFDELEKQKDHLGIQSFGLSLTTMEDVFIKVGDIADSDTPVVSPQEQFVELNGNGSFDARARGLDLLKLQVYGLVMKRFNYALRYWPMVIFQIIIPSLIFVLIFLLNNNLMNQQGPGHHLIIDSGNIYGKTIGFFNQKINDKLVRYYERVSNDQDIEVFKLEGQDTDKWLISMAKNMTLEDYSRKFLTGAEQKSSKDIIVWYNLEALHSLPISLNLVYESLNRQMSNSSSKIILTNHPFPPEALAFVGYLYTELIKFCWAVLVPLTIPFLAASYVLYTIHEKASKARLVQLMTGLNHWTLIGSNFIFDFSTHFISIAAVFAVFAIMDTNGVFMKFNSIRVSLFLLFMIFGMTSIVIAYIVTWMTDKRAGGYAILVIIYIVTGVVSSVVCSVLESLALLSAVDAEGFLSPSTVETWTWIFRASPIFSMSWGIKKLYDNGSKASVCEQIRPQVIEARCSKLETAIEIISCCPEEMCNNSYIGDQCARRQNPLQWEGKGIGKELFMMSVVFAVCLLVLILLESNIRKYFLRLFKSKPPVNTNLEDDVAEEKQRIIGLVATKNFYEDSLVVDNLTKKFGKLQAVNGVSFGVHEKECFGLLGTNGAGKTSTFRMITGDLFPDYGSAHHDQFDVVNSLSEFQQNLGYCPQFDPLLDKLTGREMLHLFGRLRGVTGDDLKIITNDLIEMAGLNKYADKRTETFSGGNKRKLSLALAIIGHPKVLLLDEPTSGVDPSSRRKIWNMLALIRNQFGCSIVLTSHSMQECESICSRIGIMVAGQFRCLGSVQHLRNKYGQGFTLMIKIKREMIQNAATVEDYLNEIKAFICKEIPSAVIRDFHETVITYHVTDPNVPWCKLFQVMELAKGNFLLEDYSVSDTSLEQIFIAFAQNRQTVNNITV